MTVTRSGGFFLEAAPSGDSGGRPFSLACGNEQKGQRQFASAPVTSAEAKALLGDFLAGGDAWQRQCRWRSRETSSAASTATPRNRSWRLLTDWAVEGGAVAVALISWFFPVLIPAGLALAFCLFVARKAWRETRVRRWPQVIGRITASGLQPRRRRFGMEATKLDNIPALAYEFSVAGRPYVGSRLNLNTEYAGVDVGAVAARYPVGALVPVYYDPADPSDCLLDPFANRGILGAALKLLAILALFSAALYYGASAATHATAVHFHTAAAPHAVLLLFAGLFCLVLFALSFRQQPSAAPRASGTIVKSEVEAISLTTNFTNQGSVGPNPYFMQPTIEVAYSVGGQNYILRTALGSGTQVEKLGFWKQPSLEERSRALRSRAEMQLAPYPVGKTVDVLYNPDNPGVGRLEGSVTTPVTTNFRIITLVCAAACFALATVVLSVL